MFFESPRLCRNTRTQAPHNPGPHEGIAINDLVLTGRTLNFVITAMRPVETTITCALPYHIQVNIRLALKEMMAGLHRGGVVSVFQKRALRPLR